jgi:hypothetical protein
MCACTPDQAPVDKPRPVAQLPPATATATTIRVGLMGASFRVPTRCTISCVADAPLSGALSCWEPSDHQDMTGSYTISYQTPFEATAPTVSEVRSVGPALVYWGHTPDRSEFCAIASLPPQSSGGPSTWRFCSRSTDATVRGFLRDIAASVEADPTSAVPSPCRNDL